MSEFYKTLQKTLNEVGEESKHWIILEDCISGGSRDQHENEEKYAEENKNKNVEIMIDFYQTNNLVIAIHFGTNRWETDTHIRQWNER